MFLKYVIDYFRAVWAIFLLSSALIVVIVAHMLTGVTIHRGICEPLKNPQNNRIFEMVDDYVEIKKTLYPKNLTTDIDLNYIIT